jgi:hypothetical protein
MLNTKSRDVATRLRQRASLSIRHAAGLTNDPPPRCDDPDDAFGDVHGVARLVHRELPSMLVGGVGSLYFQMLHPHAMAGVAQHSRYQDDPLGRVLQTANFIGATTFGSKETAQIAIDRVLTVHRYVHGVADDGVPYDANDPHLLLWVHCAEIYMFLNAYRRFGSQRLSDAEADHYVREMAPLARILGVLDPPENVEELNAAIERRRRGGARLHYQSGRKEPRPTCRLSPLGAKFLVAATFVRPRLVGRTPTRVARSTHRAAHDPGGVLCHAPRGAPATSRGDRQPSIDRDNLTGDVGRVGKRHDHLGHIVSSSGTAKRGHRLHVAAYGVPTLSPRRVDKTRRDGVHPDLGTDDFGEQHRHVIERRLRRGVGNR